MTCFYFLIIYFVAFFLKFIKRFHLFTSHCLSNVLLFFFFKSLLGNPCLLYSLILSSKLFYFSVFGIYFLSVINLLSPWLQISHWGQLKVLIFIMGFCLFVCCLLGFWATNWLCLGIITALCSEVISSRLIICDARDWTWDG